jgi:hypothetical protein
MGHPARLGWGTRPGRSSYGESLVNGRSDGELAQELTFVHAVLEGFAAVDEDDGHLVGVLAAKLVVGIDVHFLPAEQAAALELDEAFLDDFAEVATFAGVDQNVAGIGHQAGV